MKVSGYWFQVSGRLWLDAIIAQVGRKIGTNVSILPLTVTGVRKQGQAYDKHSRSDGGVFVGVGNCKLIRNGPTECSAS